MASDPVQLVQFQVNRASRPKYPTGSRRIHGGKETCGRPAGRSDYYAVRPYYHQRSFELTVALLPEPKPAATANDSLVQRGSLRSCSNFLRSCEQRHIEPAHCRLRDQNVLAFHASHKRLNGCQATRRVRSHRRNRVASWLRWSRALAHTASSSNPA